jgi:hypothetical protein
MCFCFAHSDINILNSTYENKCAFVLHILILRFQLAHMRTNVLFFAHSDIKISVSTSEKKCAFFAHSDSTILNSTSENKSGRNVRSIILN